MELKLKKEHEAAALCDSLNRTKLELKLLIHQNCPFEIVSLNRTKLELKLDSVKWLTSALPSLNRTKLELKHVMNRGFFYCPCSFKSHQIGIETSVEVYQRWAFYDL